MTKEEAQQILAALQGIKDPYNSAIPYFVEAQKTFGTQLNPLVRQYNATTAALQESFNAIRAVCARYATDHEPVIEAFSVTPTDIVARFDYAKELTVTESKGEVLLTVAGPGGTAVAKAKA